MRERNDAEVNLRPEIAQGGPAVDETTEEKRPERKPEQPEAEPMPPAGPHATPELTNEDATPGAGYLPKVTPDGESDPAGG